MHGLQHNGEVRALLGRARHLYECDAVATGHYARRVEGADGRPELLRARDEERTRRTSSTASGRTSSSTPGPARRAHEAGVRSVARDLGLATADKPESQGICFIPDGDVRGALRTRTAWAPEPGPIVDTDGVRVGEHAGAAGYTVGQRSGLGVALGEPRYVSRIDRSRTSSRSRAERISRRPRSSSTTSGSSRRGARGRGVPLRHPRPPSRRARAGLGSSRISLPCRLRRPLGRRDRHAGLGCRARPGDRVLRRRAMPRRRPDRTRAALRVTA